MATNGNWFAVSRMIFDHSVIGIRDRPYTDFEAWLWLVANAEFENKEVLNKGATIVLDPGQMMAAHGYLATQWNWSNDKVRYYIKRLQNEAMITRFVEERKMYTRQSENLHANHTRQSPTQHTNPNTNQIQVITICNYSDFQHISVDPHQANSQASHQANSVDRTRQTSKSHQQYKDNTKLTLNTKPPYPQGGQAPEVETKVKARKRKIIFFSEADMLTSDTAMKNYNVYAYRLGFVPCSTIDQGVRQRLLNRIEQIGGIEQFNIALSTIEQVPFLMGQSTPRPGEKPFRLDLERLLQDEGGLGNVLVKLVNKGLETSTKSTPEAAQAALRQEIIAMSDTDQTAYVSKHANGIWPSDRLFARPGTKDCLFRPEILANAGISVTTYNEHGIKRK